MARLLRSDLFVLFRCRCANNYAEDTDWNQAMDRKTRQSRNSPLLTWCGKRSDGKSAIHHGQRESQCSCGRRVLNQKISETNA